jgi:hypothetical protein
VEDMWIKHGRWKLFHRRALVEQNDVKLFWEASGSRRNALKPSIPEAPTAYRFYAAVSWRAHSCVPRPHSWGRVLKPLARCNEGPSL